MPELPEDWAGGVEAIATALSVFIALFVGIGEARRFQRRRREMHTLSLISLSLSDRTLQEAAHRINALAVRGANGEEQDEMLYRAILSYYHFLALAVSKGLLDREIVMIQKASAIQRAYRALEPWIERQRTSLRDPGYMGGLDRFVKSDIGRWLKKHGKRVTKPG